MSNTEQYNDLGFGEPIMVKKDARLRIGFQNFNGLMGKRDDPIDDNLQTWIDSMGFDIFGISEVNMFWPQVKQELQFHERIHRLFNPALTKAIRAYNTQEKRSKKSIRQYGGTAQINTGNSSLKFQQQGEDDTGLGRYVWQLFKGKEEKLLRVITAYRPCEPRTSGPFKVFFQQLNHFNSIGRKTDPREAILEDLQNDIKGWMADGEHIILMMDCNEDIREDRLQQFLSDTDLHEPILNKYGQDNAPNTHIQGSAPINGIFTSLELNIIAGGYTSFEDGVQGARPDHQCLWIDIEEIDVFGQTLPGRTKYNGRRVKSKDPRTRDKFNQAYKQFIIKHKLAKKIFDMEAQVTYPITTEHILKCNKIAELRRQGIQFADHQCRKLRFGGAANTPEFKRLHAASQVFSRLCQWKMGKIGAKRRRFRDLNEQPRKKNTKQFSRLLRKSNLEYSMQTLLAMPNHELLENRRKHYKEYRSYWDRQDKARSNWLTQLAKARAEAEWKQKEKAKRTNKYLKASTRKAKQPKKIQAATSSQIKSLQSEETSRKIWRRIRRAVGKNNMSGISLIQVPHQDPNNPDRVILKDITDKQDITTILMDVHERKYRQTENTAPMMEPVVSQLGYLGTSPECHRILQGEHEPKPSTKTEMTLFLQNLKKQVPNTRLEPI